jgi:hypothetical protein
MLISCSRSPKKLHRLKDKRKADTELNAWYLNSNYKTKGLFQAIMLWTRARVALRYSIVSDWAVKVCGAATSCNCSEGNHLQILIVLDFYFIILSR